MLEPKNFVDLLDAPYSRRGSYMAFANSPNGENLYGKSTLWLCNCRILGGAMSNLDKPNGFRQVRLDAVKDGVALPCVISTTQSEVILETRHGSIRFCIGERKLVMARSDDGLTLRVTPTPAFMSPASVNMMDSGRRLIDFGVTHIVVTPLTGELAASHAFLDMAPDASGVMQAAFEEFLIDPVLRGVGDYPSYETCVKSVEDDLNEFCARVMPSLPGEYESMRLPALWHTWSMIVLPDGESDYKRPMVKMMHSLFEGAFVWQQPMQAIWLSNDPELSWQVFISGFDNLDANGRMVDGLGFRASVGGLGLKPPVHGAALMWLLDRDIYKDVPDAEWEPVYEGLITWTNYFLNFRDRDGDGVAEFQSLLETGWEDAPYYNNGFPCASPDLNALLALQMEAVARLGRKLGKPAAESDGWEKKSKELIGKLIAKFWDGERWFAYNAETGVKSSSATVSLYVPLILGKRLPQDIIDKSIAFMFGPDGFNTPYGLASEGLTSDYFHHGFTQGCVITPAQLLFVLAFEACGRPDLAKTVAQGYCTALRKHGFVHITNPLNGHCDRSLTAWGEPG
ncbi:MAG: hypothetical protein LBJ99_01760, partial [Oscillospiraceae bacterium]|nr:hypothetical protein [Oscillospiraceae bacterium]